MAVSKLSCQVSSSFARETSMKGAGSAPFPWQRVADELLGAPRQLQNWGEAPHPSPMLTPMVRAVHGHTVCSLRKLFPRQKDLDN